MTKIKICGLSRLEDIESVNEFMPDYIGFVFAKSKRQVTKDKARELKEKVNPRIKVVGVFVDEDKEEIVKLCNKGVIDLVQLHGYEDQAYIMELRKQVKLPIIKAIAVKNHSKISDDMKLSCDYLLFDSFSENKRGGTGQTFNWEKVSHIKRPFFIAGGINIENVLQVISKTKPYAIDLSSGVETDGYKDRVKIQELIYKVRGERRG